MKKDKMITKVSEHVTYIALKNENKNKQNKLRGH
jgi:hypothetical protein